MKFKDKAGNVFANIGDAIKAVCNYRKPCKDCPIYILNNRTGDGCYVYAVNNPAEAARLMGYEVVEDEKKVDKTKPVTRFDAIKACETPEEMVIQLTVNARHFCPKGHVAKVVCKKSCGECIVEWLSGEDEGVCLSEQETEDVRTIVRLFGCAFTRLVRSEAGFLYLDNPEIPFGESVVVVQDFPSIRPGQAVSFSDIVGR